MSLSRDAAPSVEAATSDIAVLKLILDEHIKTNKKLSEVKDAISYIFEKVSNIESRQSLTSGLENDAVRAVSQYATAESSALPEAAFKKAFDLSKTSEPTHTYYKTFYEKDMRRCEYELLKLFEHMIEDKSYLFEADKQHSTGEAIHKLPAIRTKLMSSSCNLSDIPNTFEKLYKLKLPMHRNMSVCTIKKLIERMVVPPTFETTDVVTEEEAKEIWASLVAEHDKLCMIDWIPLCETLDEKTWHERLLEKIHAYNQHFEAVKHGEYCERCDDFYTKEQDVDRKTLAKKAKLQHETAAGILEQARRAWPEKDQARPRDPRQVGEEQEDRPREDFGHEGQERPGRVRVQEGDGGDEDLSERLSQPSNQVQSIANYTKSSREPTRTQGP